VIPGSATRHSPLARVLRVLFMVAFMAALFHVLDLPAGFAATGRVECNSVRSKVLARAVPYCVLLPPSYDQEKNRRFPILYFFHGLGDNEQMFLHSGGWNMVEDLWERKQLEEFLIATPAGGASFFINSRDGKVRYEDFLINEFLPAIERNFRVRPGRSHRAISGVSMGGYGALHLAFRHPEFFSAVSAHSAALIEKLPVFLGGVADSPRARVLGGTFGNPPDTAFWERNSPLTLARTARLTGLEIYFDCGDQDDFGFEAGATALDRVLTSRNIRHEFHLYPGRHDWQYFASHLPESLAFHSRLFGNGQLK
jgi:S-formylglutathione hydrolase FrmB